MKASGGSRWMTDLINNIVKEGCIPDDWRKSILVPVYKGKGVIFSSYIVDVKEGFNHCNGIDNSNQ